MKSPKHYPMNGPSLPAQRLMEAPRQNKKWLRGYFAENYKIQRHETLAILNLK